MSPNEVQTHAAEITTGLFTDVATRAAGDAEAEAAIAQTVAQACAERANIVRQRADADARSFIEKNAAAFRAHADAESAKRHAVKAARAAIEK